FSSGLSLTLCKSDNIFNWLTNLFYAGVEISSYRKVSPYNNDCFTFSATSSGTHFVHTSSFSVNHHLAASSNDSSSFITYSFYKFGIIFFPFVIHILYNEHHKHRKKKTEASISSRSLQFYVYIYFRLLFNSSSILLKNSSLFCVARKRRINFSVKSCESCIVRRMSHIFSNWSLD